MKRTVMSMCFLTGVWLSWSAFVPRVPVLTRLPDGQSVALPRALSGRCLRLVVIHGTCKLCEGAADLEGVTYLTMERHPGDTIYKPLVVSRQAYDALEVEGIPVEFILSRGQVLSSRSPYSEEPRERCGDDLW